MFPKSLRTRRSNGTCPRFTTKNAAALVASAATFLILGSQRSVIRILQPLRDKGIAMVAPGMCTPAIRDSSQRLLVRPRSIERASTADRVGATGRPNSLSSNGNSAGEPEIQGRRALVGTGMLATVGAAAAPATAAGEPEITARCAFSIRVGVQKMSRLRRLVIGLFGKDAPMLTRTFIQACTGTYEGESGGNACYRLSDVKTIIKDKAVTWANFAGGNSFSYTVQTDDKRWIGYKTMTKPLAGPDTFTDEVNNLRHDLPGRVSMRRGGGTFDFTVSPVADATWLDKTDVVIGQVLEGMDLIAEINQVGMYNQKPLKKIRIINSELLA